MAKEIELKLRLSPAQARRLQAHPVLSGNKPQKYQLLNTYYDTPDFDLRQRGIALRLRRKGWAVWLMTVKCGASGAGGLAQRSEWEAPTQPGVFDFSIVTDSGLREFLEAQHSRLQPVFSTDFTRTAWTLDQAGSVVELALDRGKINAIPVAGDTAPVSEPLCEVELELVEGASPDALFDLAIALASDLHLHPEIASKAERGYALAEGVLANPVKGFVSTVNKDMSPVDSFRSIALSCLTQLQRNEAGAIAGKNPEYVHQARVAIRRLRSAFKLFSPVLGVDFVEVYSPRWRELASGLGSARDWDVFLTETLAPLEEAFPGDADLAVLRAKGEATKAKAQASAGIVLTQKDYSQLLLAFSAALFRVDPPTIDAQGKASALKLRKFAGRRLQKRAEMIEQLVNEHGKMNAERRHELRIAFKKLRYALEFFAPILPCKRLSAYQLSLSTLQDLLGTLNDQVTASRLIKEMHPKGEPNPLTRGWIAGRTQLLVTALNDELRGFMTNRKPWL
ncbi:CHAD domain-containing protein [Propionivibrio sp.]|uniref:CYTH and CHAD domain-containing protein n=1 Tax=Propionivibrio sp. TaxID=2212460 RepID=UPI003BF15646